MGRVAARYVAFYPSDGVLGYSGATYDGDERTRGKRTAAGTAQRDARPSVGSEAEKPHKSGGSRIGRPRKRAGSQIGRLAKRASAQKGAARNLNRAPSLGRNLLV